MDTDLEFEWDDAKADANSVKHGVPFPYATRVFLDANRVDLDTSRPIDGEVRRKVIGVIEGRLYCVVYTQRDGVTRLISARRTNTNEEKSYGSLHT